MGFGLAVMLVFVACEDEEPELFQQWKDSEWYAAGNDVAPLFRAFPLNYDSIYMKFRNHRNKHSPDVITYYMTIKMFKIDDGSVNIITGDDKDRGAKYNRTIKENDSIIWFSTLDANLDGTRIKIEGIYKDFESTNPVIKKMEFVYIEPGWPDPPNAEEGFGNTHGGAYGDNNIHSFTKLIKEEEDD